MFLVSAAAAVAVLRSVGRSLRLLVALYTHIPFRMLTLSSLFDILQYNVANIRVLTVCVMLVIVVVVVVII